MVRFQVMDGQWGPATAPGRSGQWNAATSFYTGHQDAIKSGSTSANQSTSSTADGELWN